MLGEMVVVARNGMLERVMALVQDRRYPRWKRMELLAVIPHIPSLREQLARELPHLEQPWYRRTDLAGHAFEAFLRRELLEAVGAGTHAAHWDAIYRRHDAMLRDPDRAVALSRLLLF